MEQQAKLYEGKFLHCVDDLEKLAEELTRAKQREREFTAAINHELRTPLNAILGKASVLLEKVYGPLTPNQQRAATVILDNGNQLLSLIDSLTDWTDIESNHVSLRIKRVELQTLIDQILTMVYNEIESKQLQFEVNHPEQSVWIAVDQSRFEQILLILLDNALKFTPAGGKIGLGATVTKAQTHEVELTVWDTGVGIPESKLDMIFLPFTQLDGQLSRQYEGIGLGLPLAHRLVQLHGGRLSVENQVGQGSRFTITLPVAEPDT